VVKIGYLNFGLVILLVIEEDSKFSLHIIFEHYMKKLCIFKSQGSTFGSFGYAN